MEKLPNGLWVPQSAERVIIEGHVQMVQLSTGTSKCPKLVLTSGWRSSHFYSMQEAWGPKYLQFLGMLEEPMQRELRTSKNPYLWLEGSLGFPCVVG